MSSDFWAGYVSGAAGILIGNPLDIVKVRLQAGETGNVNSALRTSRFSSFIKGATAPLLGYGALNALLFVSYNRSLMLLDPNINDPTNIPSTDLSTIWFAGAIGGLATWAVSAPTELIKCRTQVSREALSSWTVAKDIWRQDGMRGLYHGGGVTSVRDAVGYGFYFGSYELCKRWMVPDDESDSQLAWKVLLCGGVAGVVTWTSIFPLDVIKTRLQTQQTLPIRGEQQSLLGARHIGEISTTTKRMGAFEIARQAYHEAGARVFFKGLGVCSVRAFVVNAVQWAVYEWTMRALKPSLP